MDVNKASLPTLQREDSVECAICLQPCMQPVQLPCSHIFCFLCAKGTAMQSRKCALCRSNIPNDFISKPSLFAKANTKTTETTPPEERYVWFYQGYNGWWQYDERTCVEIEAAYANKAKSTDVLVAGSVYVIDFENNVQYQRNRNSRKRKIKRDLATAQKKGVAGLEVPEAAVAPAPSTSTQMQTDCINDSASTPSPISAQSMATDDAPTDVTCEITRQIPIGSEELLRNQPAGSSGLSLPFPVPPLTRSATEHAQGPRTRATRLRRFDSDTQTLVKTGDEPME